MSKGFKMVQNLKYVISFTNLPCCFYTLQSVFLKYIISVGTGVKVSQQHICSVSATVVL